MARVSLKTFVLKPSVKPGTPKFSIDNNIRTVTQTSLNKVYDIGRQELADAFVKHYTGPNANKESFELKDTRAIAQLKPLIYQIEQLRERISDVQDTHFNMLLDTVLRVTQGGEPALANSGQSFSGGVPLLMPNPSGTGFIKSKVPSKYVEVKTWKALSPKYRKKRVANAPFWSKRGGKKGSLGSRLEAVFSHFGPELPKPVVNTKKIPRRAHRKDFKRSLPLLLASSKPMQFELLENLLSDPFFSGVPQSFPVTEVKKFDRVNHTHNLLVFLEAKPHKHGGRPFIRGAAAFYGEQMRKALRKL